MTEPLVCAVMLVNGREAMVRRAVASFRAQTYGRKRLMILDSAKSANIELVNDDHSECSVWMPDMCGKSIGALRNAVNWCARDRFEADIIAHFDSDDLSNPHRLAEQVALLQSSGAECVGYHQAVFWREPSMVEPGEAWIYTGQVPRLCAIGASLCYWRKTWERVPFDDLRDVRDLSRMVPGEDSNFVAKVKAVGVSALPESRGANWDITPRIICAIHGGNTVKDALKPGAREWRRAPNLDSYCREAMRL